MREQKRKKTNKEHCNTALGSILPSGLHSPNKTGVCCGWGSAVVWPSMHEVVDFTFQHSTENNKKVALYF